MSPVAILCCLTIALGGCAAVQEVGHEYVDGLRADAAAPGQVLRGYKALGELRGAMKDIPASEQWKARAEWLEAHPEQAKAISELGRLRSSGRNATSAPGSGVVVYSAAECIGAIVNGVCQGTILPNQATHPVCHGEMLNGQCTGPMF